LFSRISEMSNSKESLKTTYDVKLSFLEIYNEKAAVVFQPRALIYYATQASRT